MDKFITGIIIVGFILVCILIEKIRKTEWWNHRGLRETLRCGTASAKMDVILLLHDTETKADIMAMVYSLRDPVTRSTAISVLKNMKPCTLEILRKALRSEKDKEMKEIIMEVVKELERKYEHSLN